MTDHDSSFLLFNLLFDTAKVQYLQDNAVMPITLYLKYDPLAVLSENCEKGPKTEGTEDEKQEESESTQESCTHWKSLQDDIYRWAVDQQHEWWITVQDCDVMSMPPIQSTTIERNIVDYFAPMERRKQVQFQIAKVATEQLRTLDSFATEDEQYKS